MTPLLGSVRPVNLDSNMHGALETNAELDLPSFLKQNRIFLMKTQLLLPAIFLSTISLAYAGGRTPPANGNSNSSRPTQAEVTGEPSKGGSFQDDGSEGIGGDPGTPEESGAVSAMCAALQSGLDELAEVQDEKCGAFHDLNCTGTPDEWEDSSCDSAWAECELATAEMMTYLEGMDSLGIDGCWGTVPSRF